MVKPAADAACDCRRQLLVPETGAPPTGANRVTFCTACGLFYVTRTQGRVTTCSTFRLSARHLKVLAGAAGREGAPRA